MADWGRIGEVLGTGLGETLKALADKKSRQLAERNAIKNWQALGVDQQKAQALAGLPPQFQQQAFEELLPALQLLQQKPSMMQKQKGFDVLQESQEIQQPGTDQQIMQKKPMQKAAIEQPEPQGLLTKSQRKSALEQQKLQHKASIEATKQQHHADKETSKFYKETLQGAKSADNNDRRLNRMETLVKRGKLTNPKFHSLLNTLEHGIFGFGINLHSLENADSQEFNKISKEFLKDAKEVFGARLTNLDVDTFLKMVPDLTQSDEGKMRIINNMKAYNEANRIRKQAMESIIKENGGKRPLNLESLVEERAGKKLDELAQKFKEGYGEENKEQPSESSPSVLDKVRSTLGLI